jgi:hypothetical protein
MSMIDAVRARVKQQGGDTQSIAETLYEMAAQTDFQDEIGSGETISAGVFESLFEEGVQAVDGEKQDDPTDTPPNANFD